MTSPSHRLIDQRTGPEAGARLLLGLALCLAGVRFVGLERWGLWVDEAFTLADASGRLERDNPVGYLLYALWFEILGSRPTEFLLRLPSAVAGCLSIAAIAWAFGPFVGRRPAAAAALFVSLSTWHLYWSQTARFYTLALFVDLLFAGLYLRACAHGSRAQLLAALLCGGIGMGLHPSSGLLVGALLASGFVVSRWRPESFSPGYRKLERLLLILAFLALAAASPWIAEVWRKWQERAGGGSPVHLIATAGWYVTPGVGALLLLGAWSALRSGAGTWERLALATVVGTAGTALVASLFVRASAQYLFVLLPWIAIVAALPFGPRGLRAGRGALESRTVWIVVALVALPSLLDGWLYFGVRGGDRPGWRAAYELVAEQRRSDDHVLGMQAPVGEYYGSPTKTDVRLWRDVTWLDEWRSDAHERFARYGRRTWLVVNHEMLQEWPRDERERFRKFLASDCAERASYRVPWTPRDLDVFVYLHDPWVTPGG